MRQDLIDYMLEDDDGEDPDFYEEYMNYRRPCEDCEGRGSVRSLTELALQRPRVAEYVQDFYDTEAIYAAERRMGA